MLSSKVIEAVISYCKINGYQLFTNRGQRNIFYIEGMNTDGQLNDDRLNQFNDVRFVLDHQFKLLGNWSATTEPGRWYTQNPMNPKGAARAAFGQYTAWSVGVHGNSEPHEALVQVRPISVWRDRNKDGFRNNDKSDTGLFGINQHWGYDLPLTDIGKASAGCLVGRTRQGHREFMAIVKSDVRFRSDRNFVFTSTIIPGDKLKL